MKVSDGLPADLFQPDSLLPSQFYKLFRRKAHLEPEKRLLLAVLEDAVTCFQKHFNSKDVKKRALFRDAEEWIFGKGSGWLLSFEAICEALEIDPAYLRKGLTAWKKTKLKKVKK